MSGGSWYNSSFSYRWPVAVHVQASGSGSHNKDVEIVIPAKWDAFWSNIQSNGYDIYCVDNDCNLLVQNRSGFNYANRTLTMRVQNLPVVASATSDRTYIIYIYWGNPSAANSDTVFTPSSPLSGQIFLGRPTNLIAADNNISRGGEAPPAVFIKPESNQQYAWFKFGNLLSKRISTYNKFLFYEGVQYVEAAALNPDGSSITLVDGMKTRFLPGYVGIFIVNGGANGQDYQVNAKVQTTEEQTFNLKATLSIRDLLPASR
tara:strand:+ start:10990 stop:11772 length:783 start_codon:yes stop_codon:yes gene_type:complete